MLTFFVILLVLLAQAVPENLKLQRVVVLSRHNVRSPLSEHLAEITPRPWPHWDEKSGYLTPKGVYLEGLMGDFFSKWLQNEGLLPQGCPEKDDVFVYANSKQRTKVTARAFILKAFPECNVTIHVGDKSDPVFSPFIHNNTDAFRKEVVDSMQQILDSLNLNSSYELLENILDYKDSDICKTNHKCDLETDMNKINEIAVGKKPTVSGPLKICNTAIDAFKMEYYNGFSLPDVAWGELNNSRWETLSKLMEGYHNVIFNSTILAKDIALPLIKYMKDIFINKNTKFTLLMGHDANILTFVTGMRFKPYILPNQYEKAPIGGKIVFQKWLNTNGEYFLRIQYVYASTNQLRVGSKLSLVKPPQFKVLELEDCPVNNEGFCPWETFEKLLRDF